MQVQAEAIIKNNQLESESESIHRYKHAKGGYANIDVDQNKCTCHTLYGHFFVW